MKGIIKRRNTLLHGRRQWWAGGPFSP